MPPDGTKALDSVSPDQYLNRARSAMAGASQLTSVENLQRHGSTGFGFHAHPRQLVVEVYDWPGHRLFLKIEAVGAVRCRSDDQLC